MAIASEAGYIQHFISSIGLSSTGEKELANLLIQTADDCKDFYIGFLGRNRQVIDDLLDYREQRLSLSKITLDKFIWLCDNEVKHEIFEQIFLQKFTREDISLIDKAISEGKTSLDDIFNNFQKNPNKNILKNVL